MAATQAPPLERFAYTSGHGLSVHELAMMQPQPHQHQHQQQMHHQQLLPAGASGYHQVYHQNNQIYHRHQYPCETPHQAAAANNSYYMDPSHHQFGAHHQANYTTTSGSQALPAGYCAAVDHQEEHYLSQINLSYTPTTHQDAPPAPSLHEPPDTENLLSGTLDYFAPPPVPHQQHQHHQPETAEAVFFHMAPTGSHSTRHPHSDHQFPSWISGSSSNYQVAAAAPPPPPAPPHHFELSETQNRHLCPPATIYHLTSNTSTSNSASQTTTSIHQSAPNTQVHPSKQPKSTGAPKTATTTTTTSTTINLKSHHRPLLGFGVTARRKNATRETTANLKSWLEEHGHNPYPSKGEKIMLAMVTRLSMTQVSTWFANARRRMKKENKLLSWAIQRPPAAGSSSSTTPASNSLKPTTITPHHLNPHSDTQARSQLVQESSQSRALKYLMNRHYLGPGLALSHGAYQPPSAKQDQQQQQVLPAAEQRRPSASSGGAHASSGSCGTHPGREKVVRQAHSSKDPPRAAGGRQSSNSSSGHSIATATSAETSPRPAKWNSSRHRKRAQPASVDSDGAPSTTTGAC